MDNKSIEKFNNIIKNNNQYKDDSGLWKSIQLVFDCTEKKAKSRAKEYCNVISLFAVCRASDNIEVSLELFISYGISSKKIREDGFIKASKKDLLKYYGMDISMEYFENYSFVEDASVLDDSYFYQMKIKSRSGGWHFIGCYVKDNELYLSDSSNRGIGVLVKDVVSKKYFKWLLKIG